MVATVGGVGYVPLAPGTVATAVSAALYWFFPSAPYNQAALITFLFFLGVWGARHAEGIWGPDSSPVVIDELVGFLVAVFALPKTVSVLILGFFLFRVLDVVKPFPIGRSQRLRGGWGVMVDDCLAGVYTNVLIRLWSLIRG